MYEDEIEWNRGEYGEGQSNYNKNPEAIKEKINEFVSKEFLHSKKHCKQNQNTKIYAEKKHYKSYYRNIISLIYKELLFGKIFMKNLIEKRTNNSVE